MQERTVKGVALQVLFKVIGQLRQFRADMVVRKTPAPLSPDLFVGVQH